MWQFEKKYHQILDGEEHGANILLFSEDGWDGKKGNFLKLLFKTIEEFGHTYSVALSTMLCSRCKGKQSFVWVDVNNTKMTGILKTMDSLSRTVGKCPPGLTMPNSSARWSPNSCFEGSTDVNQKEKKNKNSPLTNLACFSAFFAAFSASFCCFFRPFFDWAWSASAALKQEEAHNKHLSQLPPSISPASHEEVVDRLGKLIWSRRDLQLLSLHF